MRIFYIVGIVVALVLFFIDYTYTLGVILALGLLINLTSLREFFNKRVMEVESFSAVLFFGYTALVFVLIFIALGLTFVFSDYISPYTFAGTIVVQRVFMFVDQIITVKEQRKKL